jgi:hypothetical protein
MSCWATTLVFSAESANPPNLAGGSLVKNNKKLFKVDF